MVVKGHDGLLLYESKESGQARPTSRATASSLLRALVVCCCKSFASMTYHHGAQPQTQTLKSTSYDERWRIPSQ